MVIAAPMKEFTKRLQHLTSGKSVQKVSTETKLPQDYISCLFNETDGPTAFALRSIADAYGVTTDYLLGRTEDGNPSDKYMEGVKYAIYEILKELDIYGSTEIRNSGDTDDGMCAATAERIIAAFSGRTEEKEPAQAEAGQAHKEISNTNNIAQCKEVVKNFTNFPPILMEFARQCFGDINVQHIYAHDDVNADCRSVDIEFVGGDGDRYRILLESVETGEG